MRWILIGLICAYRRFVPARFKRSCLFKETCSQFTLRVTREGGFWAGCRAIRQRVWHCRPQYSAVYDEETCDWQIELTDGTRVPGSAVADFVLEPYRRALTRTVDEQRLSLNGRVPGSKGRPEYD
jgi:hypothetical protein